MTLGSYLRNIFSVLQIDLRCDGSTFTEKSRSIRQHIQPHLVVTCGIFSKRHANCFWCDGSTLTDTSRSTRVESSRLDNIFNDPC